jgi:adenylosuccinate lyase
MIPRYRRPQMAKIWVPENYFHIQLDIEAYACEAQEKLGVTPERSERATSRSSRSTGSVA